MTHFCTREPAFPNDNITIPKPKRSFNVNNIPRSHTNIHNTTPNQISTPQHHIIAFSISHRRTTCWRCRKRWRVGCPNDCKSCLGTTWCLRLWATWTEGILDVILSDRGHKLMILSFIDVITIRILVSLVVATGCCEYSNRGDMRKGLYFSLLGNTFNLV